MKKLYAFICMVIFGTCTNANAQLAVSLAYTNPNICSGEEDGSVIATVTGGSGNYGFLWNTGSTGTQLADLGPGTYSLTVTDFNLCRNSDGVDCSAAASVTLVCASQQCPAVSLVSNFNGTAIKAGDYIWFSSVFKLNGNVNSPVTITVSNQTIKSGDFTITLPNATFTVSSSNTTATTTYNGSEWVSSFPLKTAGNDFLSGIYYKVPAGGIPGNLNNVSWSGSFTSSPGGLSMNWQWAAAAYSQFSTNLASLGVKPCDDGHASIYQNGDNAGTPENYKAFVVTGAKSNGGHDYTGSYSGNGSLTPCTGPSQGITLTKSANVCEIAEGSPTPVTYTYVVTDTGELVASGTITDNDGTPGNSVFVCNWGPIARGATATCSHIFTISDSTTNIATAVASFAGNNATETVTAAFTVTALSCSCNLSYPDSSNLPRSAVAFNESSVLVASDPGPYACGGGNTVIKMWYNDEHAMTLGVRQVIIKHPNGKSDTTNYAISATPTSAECESNLLFGDTISSGAKAGNDVAAGGGRPMWPALFITDLTVNGNNSRAGDWQRGGQGYLPTSVCGTWKGAVRTVDSTQSHSGGPPPPPGGGPPPPPGGGPPPPPGGGPPPPGGGGNSSVPTVTVTCDADPTKEDWHLGMGSDTPPGGYASYQDQGYGAEVRWTVADLGLISGHIYRLQFMVHDGDQNQAGGDVGEMCTTLNLGNMSIPCAQDTSRMELLNNGQVNKVEAGSDDFKVTVYPNPSNNNFHLMLSAESDESYNMRIFDMLGQVVENQTNVTYSNNVTFGNALNSGVYLVQVTQGSKTQVLHIVKAQ